MADATTEKVVEPPGGITRLAGCWLMVGTSTSTADCPAMNE